MDKPKLRDVTFKQLAKIVWENAYKRVPVDFTTDRAKDVEDNLSGEPEGWHGIVIYNPFDSCHGGTLVMSYYGNYTNWCIDMDKLMTDYILQFYPDEDYSSDIAIRSIANYIRKYLKAEGEDEEVLRRGTVCTDWQD